MSIFSSYAVMSEPAPERFAAMGWTGDEGLADLRMFLHYFRKTPDGRVPWGLVPDRSASAPRPTRYLTHDAQASRAPRQGFGGCSPNFSSSGRPRMGRRDRCVLRPPSVLQERPRNPDPLRLRVLGHGVNATYIAGQCLASLVLGRQRRLVDACRSAPGPCPGCRLSRSGLSGAGAIRSAILACEEADEQHRQAPALARAIASLPKILGLRIGVR